MTKKQVNGLKDKRDGLNPKKRRTIERLKRHPDIQDRYRMKSLPIRGVYDLSVLSVGDLIRELRSRGFHGEMTYKP